MLSVFITPWIKPTLIQSTTNLVCFTITIFNKSKNIEIYTLDTLEFTPSYIEILFKVEECSDKNGGTNGIITQIPPIGVSIDGIPFSYDNYDKVKNYSGYWIEDNQVKIFLKKADFPQWIGNCQKIKFKILAWR